MMIASLPQQAIGESDSGETQAADQTMSGLPPVSF
jgi:hypothetical protein